MAKTLAEQPVAWVNNEFQQYVFNVTDILSTADSSTDTNLTLSFESPYLYGLNASGFAPDDQTFGDVIIPSLSSAREIKITNVHLV